MTNRMKRRVVQMGVVVRCGRKVAVSQPFLNLFERYAVGEQERNTGVAQIVKEHVWRFAGA